MGKTRKQRHRHRRDGAAPLPGGAHAAAGSEQEVKQSLAPIMQRFADKSAAIRGAACHAIAGLALERKGAIPVLVRAGVIHQLLVHAFDADISVGIAALGALRNMCEVGGEHVVEELIKNDVMTNLTGLLNRQAPAGVQPKKWLELQSLGLALLIDICESSDANVLAQLVPSILGDVTRLLGASEHPLATVEAARFLQLIAEGSLDMVHCILASDALMNSLVSLVQSHDSPRVRVLGAGVLVNIVLRAPDVSQLLGTVLPVLHSALDIHSVDELGILLQDLRACLRERFQERQRFLGTVADEVKTKRSELNESQQEQQPQKPADEEERQPDIQVEQEAAGGLPANMPIFEIDRNECWVTPLSHWRERALAVQGALQLCANLSVEEDDESEQKHSQATASPATERAEFLLSQNMLPKIFHHCWAPLSAQMVSSFAEAASREQLLPPAEVVSATDLLWQSQEYGLAALGNILIAARTEALLHLQAGLDLPSLWNGLCDIAEALSSLLHTDAAAQAIFNLGATTSTMWSLLRKQCGVVPTKQQVELMVKLTRLSFTATPQNAASHEQNEQLLQQQQQMAQACERVRANVAGIMGCAGVMPQLAGLTFVFGSVLLNMLCGDSSPEAVVEAGNALIDIFAEDNLHLQTLQQLQLLDTLSVQLPQLAHKMELCKMQQGPSLLTERMEELCENLAAFVEYKKKQ